MSFKGKVKGQRNRGRPKRYSSYWENGVEDRMGQVFEEVDEQKEGRPRVREGMDKIKESEKMRHD